MVTIAQINKLVRWTSPQLTRQRIQSNLKPTLTRWNYHSMYKEIIKRKMIKVKEMIKIQGHKAKKRHRGNLKHAKVRRHLKCLSISLSNKNARKGRRSPLWSAAYSTPSVIQRMSFCSRIKRYRRSLRYLSASFMSVVCFWISFRASFFSSRASIWRWFMIQEVSWLVQYLDQYNRNSISIMIDLTVKRII